MGNRFAPSDNVRVDLNAADFCNSPVVDIGALHFATDTLDHGNDTREAFNVGNLRGHGGFLLMGVFVDERFRGCDKLACVVE